MSKIVQIEAALRRVNGATFQRICDAVLYRKGYEQLNSIGTAIGADKVATGTPDTLVVRPDGTYVFAEYTTQKTNLLQKLRRDLENCFDEGKTGIPVERISEVILCHSSRLSADQQEALSEDVRTRGSRLVIMGLSELSHTLTHHFPGIAKEHLGVEIDTGQILTPDEFAQSYGRSPLATPLDTPFSHREEEIAEAVGALTDRDVLLLTGPAGVGKSRLGLEVIQRFCASDREFQPRCIFNRGADLFDDLHVHFSAPGKYILMVDDANRLSGFDYVLQLLNEVRTDRTIKILVTVRSYAAEKIREHASRFGRPAEVLVEPLTDEEIRDLVQNATEVRHPLFLERIATVARGNARLALMAAELATRENSLASIGNVSSLYDQYFSSIRQDLVQLADGKYLQVAGVTSFFRAIDRSQAKQMDLIADEFDVSEEVFWASALDLHNMEILDVYEDEVVRISDQVLSSYLFYLACFKERVLGLAALFGPKLFPRMRARLVDALNPVLETFDSDIIKQALEPALSTAWEQRARAGDDDGLVHLMDAFGKVLPTRTLREIQRRIAALEPETVEGEAPELDKKDANIRSPSILSVLRSFGNAPDDVLTVALELLWDYLRARPREVNQILHLLREDFSFSHYSYYTGYRTQRLVLDSLWEAAGGGDNTLFAKLYIAVAGAYLRTRFRRTESTRALAINIREFEFPENEELRSLRNMIWERLFLLVELDPLRASVIALLRDLAKGSYEMANREILAEDAEVVVPKLIGQLSSSSAEECLAGRGLIDLDQSRDASAAAHAREHFDHPTIRLMDLLLADRRRDRHRDWRDHEEAKERRIAEHCRSFGPSEYAEFLDRCRDVQVLLDDNHGRFRLQSGIALAIEAAYERDPELAAEVIENEIERGNPLELQPRGLVSHLIGARGADAALETLSERTFSGHDQWLFEFYRALPEALATAGRADEVRALYESADPRDLPTTLEFVEKYARADPEIVVKVTETVVGRCATAPAAAHALSDLFNFHTEISKRLAVLFAARVPLLQAAYVLVAQFRDYSDYDGSGFNVLLDLNPNFAVEYCEWMFAEREGFEWPDHERDFSFIWNRDDHREIITSVLLRLFELEQAEPLLFESFATRFFLNHSDEEFAESIRPLQDDLLGELVQANAHDRQFIVFLFEIIKNLSHERRYALVEVFLNENTRLDDFEALSIEPTSWSAHGSWVPVLQRRIEFHESLLRLMNRATLLGHRELIEGRISTLRTTVEEEKKKDFVEYG